MQTASVKKRERHGCDKQSSSVCTRRLLQILRACSIRGLASLATLTANTFHATTVNSSFGVCITNSWRTSAQLAGGGREACLLCKGSSLPLLSFFLYSSSPTPSPFHLTHGSFRSHHLTTPSSPTCNHLLPHDKHAHAAITPQENALASWGCSTHLIIRRKNQHLQLAGRHIWLKHQTKDLLTVFFPST